MKTMNTMSVIEAEHRLTEAERSSDRDALASILDDAFVGINVRGERVDRLGFIHTFCDSGLQLRTLSTSDLVVREVDTVSIVFGRARFEGLVGSIPVMGCTQFMDCWRRTESGWKLLSSASTKTSSQD